MNEEFMKKIFPFIIIIQLLLAFYFIFILLIEKSGKNNGLNRMKIILENSNNIVDDYERQQNLIPFKQIFRSPKNRFTFNGNDAIVFLHIQKTAGTTFERFMVKRLNIKNPCVCNLNGKKRCNCLTPNGKIWLFSRYSTGWVDWACGLHADYTQLVKSKCVDYYFGKKEGKKKNRLFLTTLLRDPVERFISEYSHVARGATWKRSTHFCGGRKPTPAELPKCYNEEKGWEGIGIDQFIACPYNLAFNRQTRMLADLTLVNCYNRTSMDEPTRNKIMLESAIRNLKNFAFFGIKERMAENQFIFERTFDLRFSGNLADWNKSKSSHITISPEQLDLIRAKNNLDLKLYEFAEDLFNQRLALLGWNTSSSMIS